jgi:Flp pilus assembly protein TadD
MHRQFWSIVLLIGCSAALSGCANLKFGSKEPTFGSPAAGGTTAAMPDPIADAGKPLAGSDDPKNATDPVEAQFALARLCERRGETTEADHIYHVLLETNPNDARLHHRLGVLAVQSGNFTEAEQCFRTAQSFGPPTADLLSDLGYCYYLQHRLPEAEATLREALKVDSKHAAAMNNLALVVGRQGRIQESLDWFKRSNNEAEAYSNVAYILAQNGNFAEAQKMYLHALTLDNNMKAAAKALLQINQRQQAPPQIVEPHPTEPVVVASHEKATSDMAGQLVRLPKTDMQ